MRKTSNIVKPIKVHLDRVETFESLDALKNFLQSRTTLKEIGKNIYQEKIHGIKITYVLDRKEYPTYGYHYDLVRIDSKREPIDYDIQNVFNKPYMRKNRIMEAIVTAKYRAGRIKDIKFTKDIESNILGFLKQVNLILKNLK